MHPLIAITPPSPHRRFRGGRCAPGPATQSPAWIQSRHVPAFTLIEVIVVLTIIAIAAAMVVPSMLQGGTMSAQAAARMIIADLLVAQNEAIARQAACRVIFDVANDGYELRMASGDPVEASWRLGGGTSVVDLTADSRFQGVRLTAADFGDGKDYIQYDDVGVPDTGGYVELEGGTVSYRITVSPVTGRVTIVAN